MTELNYTKGELRVGEPFGQEYPIYAEDGYEIARVFIHNGEQEANAYLLAQAPKLYEALKAFDKYLSTPPPDNMKYKRHAVNLMDEALASVDRKGEGK